MTDASVTPAKALFREDAYQRQCAATVTAVHEADPVSAAENNRPALAGVELDATVFYPTGGGQPGDTGTLTPDGGTPLHVVATVKGDGPDRIIHLLAEGEAPPPVGTSVSAELDWERRYRHMRMHSALHLLSAVLPYPVTGGQIGADKGRLDFDIPEMTMEKDEISARLGEMIAANHVIGAEWISDEELESNPDLVKTMMVKPPSGSGQVRLLRIEGLDLQPCGGTHVASTKEIGAVEVRKIEKKGRQNRRVVLGFPDA